MPRRTMLLVAALTVALGLSGAALSKNKPGKPPHKPLVVGGEADPGAL